MKLLILCNAGMSSSILMKKMKQAAEGRDLDIEIEAKSTADIPNEVGKWDVCLVAPQIVYALENVKTSLQIPVIAIDFRDYAIADGNKVLDQAIATFENK